MSVTARLRDWARDPVRVVQGVMALGVLAGLAVSQEALLVILGVVGLALAWLGASRPMLLVAAMFVAMLFDKLGLTGAKLGDFPITLSKLSVLGGLGLWVLHALLQRKPVLRWHPALGGLGVFFLATLLSSVVSNSLEAGKFSVFGLAMMWVLVALVFAILAEAPLRPLYLFLGVAISLALSSSILVSGGGGVGESSRASGTYGDPNEWATMVLLLVALTLGGLAHLDGWLARGLRLALLGLGPLAVLHSGSRAGLVVGLVVALGCLLMLRRRWLEPLSVGGLGAALAPFVLDLDNLLYRVGLLLDNLRGGSSVQDVSLNERAEIYRQGWELFGEHWLLGVGPGNFARATGFISESGRYRPAHNTYLEIAAEQGVVGLSIALAFVLLVGWALWRGWRAAPSGEHRARIFGVALGLSAVGAMAATLGLLTFSMAFLAVGVALAVLAQSARAGAEAARG